jgi:hypothetical protein
MHVRGIAASVRLDVLRPGRVSGATPYAPVVWTIVHHVPATDPSLAEGDGYFGVEVAAVQTLAARLEAAHLALRREPSGTRINVMIKKW